MYWRRRETLPIRNWSARWIAELDFERGFFILQNSAMALRENGRMGSDLESLSEKARATG
jgi:hypothetical protein